MPDLMEIKIEDIPVLINLGLKLAEILARSNGMPTERYLAKAAENWNEAEAEAEKLLSEGH